MEKNTLDTSYPFYDSKKIVIKRKQPRLLPGDESESTKIKIGSSFKNGVPLRGLTPDLEELYLPQLIGSDPKKSDWAKETENYWKNISVDIPERGYELETGLKYKTEEDYKGAKGGIPINMSQFVLWKYCLVYSRVANTESEMYNSRKILFYLYDSKVEMKNKISQIDIEKKAYGKYLEIIDKPEVITNILLVFKIGLGRVLDSQEQQVALSDLVKTRPQEFYNIVTSPSLEIKSLIERAVQSKHLVKLPNTDTYLMGEEMIASSSEELVALLSNDKGKALKSQLEIMIKNLNTGTLKQ